MKFIDYPDLQQKTLNPSFKGGVILPLLEVIFLNQQNYKNYTFNVLKEFLLDVQIVNYFPKNFYLVEPLNEKIGILKAAGLVKLWMERYIDKSYIKIKQEKTSPRIMNFQQLLGVFQILSIGVMFAIFVFVCEKFSKSKKFKCLEKVFTIKSLREKLEHK